MRVWPVLVGVTRAPFTCSPGSGLGFNRVRIPSVELVEESEFESELGVVYTRVNHGLNAG